MDFIAEPTPPSDSDIYIAPQKKNKKSLYIAKCFGIRPFDRRTIKSIKLKNIILREHCAFYVCAIFQIKK